ncbi:SLBB domain-containing protein [Occallatibacter savannae]|uniref:SLBB domain-containing protein n=1 Tax=Occallatibacter savannae TaxID=1002691 RepID=UPI0013A56511|nr:SLBB domain-containing protein [Occallatibacter savannae]
MLQGGQQQRTPIPGVNTADQTRGVVPTYSDTEPQSTSNNRNLQTGALQREPLQPEPLTEFQKFIASTTGQVLPIYGAKLFRNVPTTFSPLDMAPVPPDYVIGPGDELRIRVWGQVNFQANTRVDRTGDIYIPLSQVGPVQVAGVPYSELNNRLRAAIGRVYKNFDVVGDIGKIRAIQVYVAGEARRPGVYTISSLSTLVDAIFASGGPSVQGSLRHIQLRRGAETVAELDLYGFLIHGDKSKDVKILAGDVIYIPPVGPQAAATGNVRNPAIYELRDQETMADLLADAGGVSATASKARISIERIEDHRERHAMEVAYDKNGLGTALADGDVIRVFSIVPTYNETVTLRGSVANPGHFAWHPGMKLSELIPDKESLVARDYWWKRAQLGLPSLEFEPMAGFSKLRQPVDSEPRSIRRQMDQANQTGQTNQSDQPNTQYYSDDSQNRGQYESQTQDRRVLPADQRGASSSLGAQQPTDRLQRGVEHTEILRPIPEIDWDYADILRLDPKTLKTSIIPFDLGKLVLDHDANQDLELQSGDIVSIFSEADIRLPISQQTKFVKLEGEFLHAGIYSVHPGETLQELVSRAGGLTPNAYLYGAEFTRESTRVLQQVRIDEYVQSLDLRIQRNTLAASASGVASAPDIASASAAQASERELLTRLRQIRASGRVVLEFKPSSSGIGVIPKLPLEDGDRFILPSVPATVNVVGAVNDQNSFLFSHTNRDIVGTYLKKAGGLTRDADRKRSFVIRASGEVVGYDATKSAWRSDFDSLRIYPGDTIVIPEKTFRPSVLRGVMEWSQLFSQFALGAASISVIR